MPDAHPRSSAGPRRAGMLPSSLVAWLLATSTWAADPGPVHGAPAEGYLGLHDAAEFRIADGNCADCPAPPQALWYFRGETIAVPASGAPPSTPASRDTVRDDIHRWATTADADRAAPPFMLWLGGSRLVTGATLSADGNSIHFADGADTGFATVPRIATNLSYYDASSVHHFTGRPLRMRGEMSTGPDGAPRFVARTLWPEDFRVALGGLTPTPLVHGQSLATLIEADDGGARSPFSTRLLWQRSGAERDPERRPVIALVLNGAQGDDDEAHGGHFAVATGWYRRDGNWADWTVANFYNLANHSEKGIIASMLPMDGYLADLNSGQSWYRPSYVLVAVLRDAAAAARYQRAIARVFDRFYRHHVDYDHAQANCSGLSMDTFAGLGWQPAALGPTSRVKALAGFYYSSIGDRSIASGRSTFHYLSEERSRLYPRVAFETLGADLLALASGNRAPRTPYERQLAQDTEAIAFVHVPQFPSSRAFGRHPVASFDEYMARVPADRNDWKIVPVTPWPFPDALRDLPPAEAGLPDGVVGLLAFGALIPALMLPWAGWRRIRRRRPGR